VSGRTSSGLPFFLVPELPGPGAFRLTGPEGRHAATVRRLRVGEPLVLTDGRGNVSPSTVLEVGRAELTVDVGAAEHTAPPAVTVTLVQALPKGDRGELAVELATEAGVDAIVPWAAQRCVARWKTPEQRVKGTERWRAAAREAAKQSRRPFVPEVVDLASTDDVGSVVGRADTALVLHDAAAGPLRAAPIPAEGNVVLIVGPEGGLTEEELTVFTAAGGVPVRLGPQVLRTSTAGAVALGALGVLTGRWT
jgi:16S rRNA (uracil1498-N3)-methyltransferase